MLKNNELVRKLLLALVKKELQQKVDMRHFTPTYKPWEQRLCVIPDGDFFQVLREGQASVVTDHLDRFTENGILLQSGEELKTDIIVSATGLNLQILGGLTLTIDHEKIDTAQHMLYQGTMLNNVIFLY